MIRMEHKLLITIRFTIRYQGGSNVNHMIDKLSSIEHDAAAIMDAAYARKKEFAQEMEDKTIAFDKQLEADTNARIQQLKEDMEVDMQAKLSKQKSDAEAVLTMMEQNYQTHHGAYVKKLFETMIER